MLSSLKTSRKSPKPSNPHVHLRLFNWIAQRKTSALVTSPCRLREHAYKDMYLYIQDHSSSTRAGEEVSKRFATSTRTKCLLSPWVISSMSALSWQLYSVSAVSWHFSMSDLSSSVPCQLWSLFSMSVGWHLVLRQTCVTHKRLLIANKCVV